MESKLIHANMYMITSSKKILPKFRKNSPKYQINNFWICMCLWSTAMNRLSIASMFMSLRIKSMKIYCKIFCMITLNSKRNTERKRINWKRWSSRWNMRRFNRKETRRKNWRIWKSEIKIWDTIPKQISISMTNLISQNYCSRIKKGQKRHHRILGMWSAMPKASQLHTKKRSMNSSPLWEEENPKLVKNRKR